MPAAIPADVKYEERFIGPLTIKQSIYAGMAGGVMLYVFLFMPTAPTIVKMVLGFVVFGLTIGFVMYDLDTYILNFIAFSRSDKQLSWISPAGRGLMNISSIRANSVFIKGGRVFAVISVRPINFGVLSREDQDTVIYGFLEFLNALNFPIQIVMRSVNLDLSEYLSSLKRRIIQRDDKIALTYYEHFSEYMNDYITENKINDRLFFVIVPGKTGGGEKSTIDSLETRTRTVMDTLSLSGIITKRLDNRELLNLYSSYFTDAFLIGDEFISPITMYRKMWHEAPKTMREEEII